MRSLNIFIVASEMITDHLPHGEGWIAYNFLRGLAERGHCVHVAAPRVEIGGPMPDGMHIYPVSKPFGGSGRLSYMLGIHSLFLKLRSSVHFDIAQQLSPVETGLSLSMLGTGVPLVLGPYACYWPPAEIGWSRRPWLVSRLSNLIRDSLASFQQRQASALIVACPAAAERIISQSARELGTEVISPGIDSQAYPERTFVPAEPSILFLANLNYRKGIFTLLEAFDRIAQAISKCSLEIWGDGDEAGVVAERVAQSRFGNRIRLKGRAPRKKVGEIMRSHSVYCMPSYGEPFGMTLLEAMASGVPVVSTDAGGPPYIVHEAGGRIVPARDSEQLAGALIEILSNTSLQRSMGAYNRKRIENEFNWDCSLDKMERVYERVLSQGSDLPLPAAH